MVCADTRKQRGQLGEQLVAQYLQKDGFTILAHNYARRVGEIDLIAKSGNMIAFVEVKARAQGFFDLTELISRVKQQRIIKTAKMFILENKLDEMIHRFDVALIDNLEDGTISYLPDAFQEQEY